MDYSTKGYTSDYYTPQEESSPEINDSSYFRDITDKNCCFKQSEYSFNREVYKVSQNKYYFPKFIFFKILFYYLFPTSIIISILYFFSSEIDLYTLIACIATFILMLIASFIIVIEVFIVLEPCSLVIIYGALFYKKSKSYYYTEIENADVINGNCYLVLKNGEKENISGKDFIFNYELGRLTICNDEDRSKLGLFSNFINSYIKNHL